MMKALSSNKPAQQLDTLQQLVSKHLSDSSLKEFGNGLDFHATSTERGVLRWEQGRLVAALDILNAYQRSRRSRSSCHVGNLRFVRSKSFSTDPRTRIIELLKRWLRSNAASSSLDEEEVRGVTGLCRDLLNYPQLFPARNPRSFMQTIAEVYEHLQLQLREVLEKDKSCAELAQRVLSLSRNLIADAIAFLLLAPTTFSQTDAFASTQVVALWKSLPTDGHPLPLRADPLAQKPMKEVWATDLGSVLASVLGHSSCLRLFNGPSSGEEQASGPSNLALEDQADFGGGRRGEDAENEGEGADGGPQVRQKISEVRSRFSQGSFKSSGLAGAFRKETEQQQQQQQQFQPPCAPSSSSSSAPGGSGSKNSTWQEFLDAAQTVHDLTYLLAEVLVHFHRISEGMGDYGMIRMSPWLHPFIDALSEKAQVLRDQLENINEAVIAAYVMAPARQGKIVKPAPTSRMMARAHECIERAVTGKSSHIQALQQALNDLKSRSAPERLPIVTGNLGDACQALQAIWSSPQFRASVGDSYARLPTLPSTAAPSVGASFDGQRPLALANGPCLEEEDDDDEAPPSFAIASARRSRAESCFELSMEKQISDASTEASAFSIQTWTPDVTRQPDGLAVERKARHRSQSLPPHSDPYPSALARDDGGAQSEEATVAEVWTHRLSRVSGRLKRRDRRLVAIHDGGLHIYRPGSVRDVEAVVDPVADENSFALAGSMLNVLARKLPEGASWEDGAFVHEEYYLEFDAAATATAFQKQLKAMAAAGGGGAGVML
mmetsp:Transcript_76129/g.166145  ORF Transcript_76129/g.166145 Transcript_76129/m.166145 type:complete len:777 (+) Transcript_76129:202-2532(+)